MTYPILVLISISIIFIAIVIIVQFTRRKILNRDNFINELKRMFHDFEIIKSNSIYPDLRFSINNYNIKIYSELQLSRRFVNVYDEYIEITNVKESELKVIKRKVQDYLNCDLIREKEKVIIEISKLKNYDLLINFFKSL